MIGRVELVAITNTKRKRQASPRVLQVSTSPISLRLMGGQLAFLRGAGFEVFVATSPGEGLEAVKRDENVESFAIPIAREVSPWEDLKSLVRLYRVMRRVRPSITNVGTPKAGLLGGLAAWLSGVPCRVYTLRGLRCETAAGFKRQVLLLCEYIACRCAHSVICVSESLRQKAVKLGAVAPERIKVLASGSSNGVEIDRFAPTAERLQWAAELRRRLAIPPRAPVVGFVGRFTRDKGLPELFAAFSQLRRTFADLRLLLVGDFEEGDPLPWKLRHEIEIHPLVLRAGFVTDTALYYQLMDVLALPSHREGFPNVVLEAHAAGKPVIAARATGVADAVIDGVTGILVPVRDPEALAKGLELLLKDMDLAQAMGHAGQVRVRREFRRERVWEALAREYAQLLIARRLPLPGSEARRVVPATSPGTTPLNTMSYRLKRLIDVSVAGAALLLLAPLMAVISLLVLMTMGRPVLFRHVRPGYKRMPFVLLKFRTMNNARDPQGRLLADAERLTPLGRLLRRMSLDELPQLWNVVKGDMSLVGPRPLLMEYLDRYTPEQARRHEVKPGITGWAQVNGRNAVTWEEKFTLDNWYVEHQNLRLDLTILLKTVWRTLTSQGISQPGRATADEFRGTTQ
jgi:lipopolysaccharide/colanic/teichoic acid biosynthesis glycosyltransferase/glycosyltransferase involved in cell wall biosynthesis